MPRRRPDHRRIEWDDFAEAQERLHQALRRAGLLPPRDDVPLEVASTEWSRLVEEIVADVFEAGSCSVETSHENESRLRSVEERVG